MKLRVILGLLLFAFLPLILFFTGAVYGVVVDALLSTSCSKLTSSTVICSPVGLLTLGGFMPAVMVVTVPAAVLGAIAYVAFVLLRKKPAPK